MKSRTRVFATFLAFGCLATAIAALAGDRSAKNPAEGKQRKQKQTAKTSDKLVPLNKKGTVLLDAKGKRVLLKTKVVLREGLLEMLCCLKQTKEHESILAVDAKAYVIHTGLLALGAKPGKPVKYFPKYQPADGQRVDVFLQWSDKKGKLHRVSGQSWIRHTIHRFYAEKLAQLPPSLQIPKNSELRYDKKNRELSWYGPMSAKQRDTLAGLSRDALYRKAIVSFYKRSRSRQMNAHWVFAGSILDVDETTGKRNIYRAEGGDLICVANFPTAMLDVAIQSSSSGEANLLFEAYSERIPPLGTEVTIELIPVFKKNSAD